MVSGFFRCRGTSSLDESAQKLMPLKWSAQNIVASAVFHRLLKLILVNVQNHMMLMWKHQSHSRTTPGLNTLPKSILTSKSKSFSPLWSWFSFASWSLIPRSRLRRDCLIENRLQDIDIRSLLIRLCRTPPSDWRSSRACALWIWWTLQNHFCWF